MHSQAARRIVLWAPVVAYMAFIFYVSSLSNPFPTLTEAASDKLLHTIGYAALGFITARAVAEEGLGWRRTILLAIVIASAYGATDEWHQLYVPGRSSDIHDWYADTFGAALGASGYSALLGIWLSRRRVSEPAQT